MGLSRPLICGFLLSASALFAADQTVFPVESLKNGGKEPVAVKRQVPKFPHSNKYVGLSGTVTVEFVVDTQGNVRDPVVVRANNPWFERPAIDSILQWKFRPGEKDGRKVNVRTSQLVEFSFFDGGSIVDGGSIGPVKVILDADLVEGWVKDGLWHIPPQKNPEQLPPEFRWTVAPQPVTTAFPVYPFEALRAGQTGRTLIKFIIGPDGRVAQSKVEEASAPELGLAALAMIDAWQFTAPQLKDGRRCYAALTMTHDFNRSESSDVPVTPEAKKILQTLEKHPEQIMAIKDLDGPPAPLSRRMPVYPTKWKPTRPKGEAMIEFFIAENGDAQLPRIVSSSEPEFGYAAAQAVATWRFAVPRKAGKPVVTRVRIPIEFDPGPAPAPEAPAAQR